MKKVYLITVELESYTERPDLLEAITANVIAEGLAQYHSLGELEPFSTLKVLQSPPEELTDDDLRVRQMRDDRLRLMQRIVEKRLVKRQLERLSRKVGASGSDVGTAPTETAECGSSRADSRPFSGRPPTSQVIFSGSTNFAGEPLEMPVAITRNAA